MSNLKGLSHLALEVKINNKNFVDQPLDITFTQNKIEFYP